MSEQCTRKEILKGQNALNQFFAENPKAALAFSGGCDSAYLLAMAVKARCDVQPYFVKGPFQPEFELEDAKKLCDELGVKLKVLFAEPLEDPLIAENGSRRCYYCKRNIFTRLLEASQKDGYEQLWDGTNASDAEDDRPGMQALRELEVRSPLRIAGMMKWQIREHSREIGVFTWNKPAYACLATRIPTGTALTKEDLTRAENGEKALFSMGFSNLRVRVIQNVAKLQLPASQMKQAVQQHEEIVQALSPWFGDVLLDMKSRPEET